MTTNVIKGTCCCGGAPPTNCEYCSTNYLPAYIELSISNVREDCCGFWTDNSFISTWVILPDDNCIRSWSLGTAPEGCDDGCGPNVAIGGQCCLTIYVRPSSDTYPFTSALTPPHNYRVEGRWSSCNDFLSDQCQIYFAKFYMDKPDCESWDNETLDFWMYDPSGARCKCTGNFIASTDAKMYLTAL